jgi:hypothetical protein
MASRKCAQYGALPIVPTKNGGRSARAANGRTAAVTPTSAMKSRRFTAYPSSTGSYPTMLTVHAASRQIWITDVRFGSLADIEALPPNVRFTPKSGHWLSASGCLLCAKSRHGVIR